jgi:endogenous inhibitor of DNA gyrase (YacG/DUF329 family)
MLHKTCAICGEEFETIKERKYCGDKCRNIAKWNKEKEVGKKEHEPNTKCPTCGKLHYRKNYCMRDRIRCSYCEWGIQSGFYVDTLAFEHSFSYTNLTE